MNIFDLSYIQRGGHIVSNVNIKKGSSDHIVTHVNHELIPGTVTEISYYFFCPVALRTKIRFHDRQRVLDNLYITGRYSSPRFTLEDLYILTNQENPLWKLECFLQADNIDSTEFCDNLRLLANSVRYAFSKAVLDFRQLQKEAILTGNNGPLMKFLLCFSKQTGQLEEKLMNMLDQCHGRTEVPEEIKKASEWMYEAWVREAGKSILKITNKLSGMLRTDSERAIADRLADLWMNQKTRIEKMRIELNLSDEQLLYRQHMLKKWYQSILYLKPIYSRLKDHIGQFLAGFAAAIAMGVAMTANLWANSTFIAHSFQWVLVTVIAYAFKDRLKEWLRLGLNKMLPRMMSDSVFHFNNPSSHRRLCLNKIRVAMTDSTRISKSIMDERRKDANPFIDVLPAEDVLVIEHDIITPKRYFQLLHRKTKIVNSMVSVISKFNMRDFFRDMDDLESFFFGDIVPGENIDMEEHQKNYHVRLIVKVRNGADVKIDNYLICLTKNKIESIEWL